MRVLVNVFSVTYGGALTVARHLLPVLAEKYPDDQYDLLAKDRSLADAGKWPANVRFIVRPRVGTNLLLRTVWEQTSGVRFFRRGGYDLYFNLAGYGFILSGVPQVLPLRNAMFFEDCSCLSLKSRFKNIWRSRLQIYSLKAGASSVCVSEYMADRVRATCGRLRGLMSVIPHGIADGLLAARQTPVRCDPSRPLRLLWIGLLSRHKNLRDLLDALAVVERESGLTCDVRLAGKFGPAAIEEVNGIAGSLGLKSRIEFPGYCDHDRLIALYNWCDAYINTSLLESFDNCVAEAMALGVPSVVSDIPVHVEYGQDGVLYYRGGEPGALAGQINAIARDRELRERLSRRCVELVTGRTWPWVAEQYHDFFVRVVDHVRNGCDSHPAALPTR